MKKKGGGKVIYKKHGSTPPGDDKYKKDRIKRLFEQKAVQKKAAGPGSKRELKSLNKRLVDEITKETPEQKKWMDQELYHITNPTPEERKQRDKVIQDILGRRKPKQTKKTGGKVLYKRHGGMSHVGLYPAEEKHEGKTKATGTVSEATREENIKREAKGGGKVLETKKKKKKKQGYKARKDESIAQRVKKKRTKKQLKASRDESYGKWGKGKGKGKGKKGDDE